MIIAQTQYCICELEVKITDGSWTITIVVSEKLAETMLSLIANQVYETTVAKVHILTTRIILRHSKLIYNLHFTHSVANLFPHKQLLPVEHIREHLLNKLFKIHLQKTLLRTPNRPPGIFVILSLSRNKLSSAWQSLQHQLLLAREVKKR